MGSTAASYEHYEIGNTLTHSKWSLCHSSSRKRCHSVQALSILAVDKAPLSLLHCTRSLCHGHMVLVLCCCCNAQAVNILGVDKAVPRKILDLMDVGGLTRERDVRVAAIRPIIKKSV
eukprot:scaffold202397_cov21-Tisochrysis_lutea.AAC.1